MAFNDFQKHCRKCKKGEPCRKPHLYVLELRDTILSRKNWKNVDERHVEDMKCLYVGYSGHLPKCRASVHQYWVPGHFEETRIGKTYLCYCSGEMEPKHYTKKTRASTTVFQDNKFTLIRRLFRHENPIKDDEDPEKKEGQLAEDLRDLGYAVWAGHHDRRFSQ